MKDKPFVFIDSNVLIYAIYGTDQQKQQISSILIPHAGSAFVSTQVLKEFTNTSIKKKFHKTSKELKTHLQHIQDSYNISEISFETIMTALDIRDEYRYSFYDSLIIATALENKCNILYSEDLQHGQTIRKKLKIVNPFK